MTTAELLLEWDRRRPRSQQREFGMSELGGCRRRAGYRLAGTEPSNPGGSVQAVLGTAVHDAIADVFRQIAKPGDLVEHEVSFAGILGHLDIYRDQTVRDTKTTTSRRLSHIKVHGPPKDNLWQIHGYGAALISEGYTVRRVALDYIARDTGECWTWEQPFDPQHVADALEWVRTVRDSPLEMLPRDHKPDSAFCRHCPFQRECWGDTQEGKDPRVVLFREDPDAAKWADRLAQARDDKSDAEDREAEAKGALDAVRPDDDTPIDVGYEHLLRWRTVTQNRLDSEAVRQEYAEIGANPPEKRSTSVRLEFVPREAE